MAQNGFMPSVAMPAAKVTACCSAMPTSNVRSGKRLAKRSRPVPVGMAAVMATMAGSASASAISASAKTRVYCGGPGGALACSPVMTLNLLTPVILVGRRLGRGVAVALFRDDVQQDRPGFLCLAQVPQHRQQVVQVVAVDGADVVEAHFLEQGPAGQDAAGVFLGPARGAFQPAREVLGHAGGQVAQVQEGPAADEAGQVGAHGADRRRDAHVVVVQDDQHASPCGRRRYSWPRRPCPRSWRRPR